MKTLCCFFCAEISWLNVTCIKIYCLYQPINVQSDTHTHTHTCTPLVLTSTTNDTGSTSFDPNTGTKFFEPNTKTTFVICDNNLTNLSFVMD